MRRVVWKVEACHSLRGKENGAKRETSPQSGSWRGEARSFGDLLVRMPILEIADVRPQSQAGFRPGERLCSEISKICFQRD
jgi:hypothetical protein